jgi:hypothetical protein
MPPESLMWSSVVLGCLVWAVASPATMSGPIIMYEWVSTGKEASLGRSAILDGISYVAWRMFKCMTHPNEFIGDYVQLVIILGKAPAKGFQQAEPLVLADIDGLQ